MDISWTNLSRFQVCFLTGRGYVNASQAPLGDKGRPNGTLFIGSCVQHKSSGHKDREDNSPFTLFFDAASESMKWRGVKMRKRDEEREKEKLKVIKHVSRKYNMKYRIQSLSYLLLIFKPGLSTCEFFVSNTK